MNLLRCVVVDDDAPFIKAAQALLEAEGVTVAGTGSSIAEAVQLVGALHPDVVFLDIRLGGESGFDAARQLAVGGHVGAVIMISTHAEADYADLLTESPVLGFLPNGQQSGVAIRRILGRN